MVPLLLLLVAITSDTASGAGFATTNDLLANVSVAAEHAKPQDLTAPTWSLATATVVYGARQGFGVTVFKGNLYLTAGYSYQSTFCMTDVWTSPDAITWTQATPDGRYGRRQYHASIAINDSVLLLIAGADETARLNNVQQSNDGTHWSTVTPAAQFPPREQLSVVYFKNKILMAAGFDGAAKKNDVWQSISSGKDWTMLTSNAAFSPRIGVSLVVFNQKVWTIGSADGDKDVFSSLNGQSWTAALTSPLGFQQSGGHFAVVFNDMLWVIGGGKSGSSATDVWYTADGSTWMPSTDGAFSTATPVGLVFKSRIVILSTYLTTVWLGQAQCLTPADCKNPLVANAPSRACLKMTDAACVDEPWNCYCSQDPGTDCVGEFSNGTCSKTCGGGKMTQTFVVTAPLATGGKDCTYKNGATRTVSCNKNTCPKDCRGEWLNGTCSASCGGGKMTQTYKIIVKASNGGKICPAKNKATRKIKCNTSPCVATCRSFPVSKCTSLGKIRTSNLKKPCTNGARCSAKDCCVARANCTTFPSTSCDALHPKTTQPTICITDSCSADECCLKDFCAAYGTCSDCTQFAECGWCGSTDSCMAGSLSGPTGSPAQQCSNWVYSLCPDALCAEHDNCQECTTEPNCGWCASSRQCMAGAAMGPSEGGICGSALNWFYSTTDCPAATCASYGSCGYGYYLVPNPNSAPCSGPTCKFEDCCLPAPTCTTYTTSCPIGSAKTTNTSRFCSAKPCKSVDCCTWTCQSFTGPCPLGTVKTPKAATTICNTIPCNASQCCVAATTCANWVDADCSSLSAVANVSKACANTKCTQAECCVGLCRDYQCPPGYDKTTSPTKRCMKLLCEIADCCFT